MAVVDEDTLNRLALSMEQTAEMEPGESRAFSLGMVEYSYVFEPVGACAT